MSTTTTQLTPLSFLERSSQVWGGKVAAVLDDRQLTYAELAEEAQSVARALEGVGVQRGDRVAYLMPNVPEMLVAHFGVPLLGAVLVAVNTRLSADEIAYILGHSDAQVFVVDPQLAELAQRALTSSGAAVPLVVTGPPGDVPEGATPYADFLSAGSSPKALR